MSRSSDNEHPQISKFKHQYKKGEITRREFLRNSTLLGMSAAAAFSFAGVLSPSKLFAATLPTRGGIWKCGMTIKRIDHPSRMSWVEGANVVKQFMDYLTETGPDNITRPALAERWTASDDVKTWDFYLRKGVKFNNGDEFNADDVMFTFNQWLDPEVGSSMLGLLSYIGTMDNVEKVDDYHIRLHLKDGNIGVPEHLNNYPAVVLHRDFKGDIIKQPVGTGPYELEEFADGERAVFKRRENHWRMGEDGKSLPYLDKVMYISMDKDASLAAMQAGQIDSMYRPRPSDYLACNGMPNLKIRGVDTAGTYVVRMRVDQAPWDDVRVRTALKMCQDRKKILQIAAFGQGQLAIDAHVAPVHPEYCTKPIPEYDPKGARKLLEAYAAEKGLTLPLKVVLSTKNDLHEPAIAQTLKQLAQPAGFDIQLDITEPSKYWERWTEVSLGITSWTHRPLATMLLPLAYTKESIGAWNETKWYDDEFSELLTKAQKTLDLEKRRAIMCQIEDIMQERGPVAISYYYRIFNICDAKFQGIVPHPAMYHDFTRQMWIKA